jgi:omega-amidase
MNVAAVQLNIKWEDRPANFRAVRNLLESDPPPAGSLVVLPEMFASGFSMNVDAVAEADGGETARFLSLLATDLDSNVLGGLATRTSSGKTKNEAILCDRSGLEILRYAKRHLFSIAGEADHYQRGEEIVSATVGDAVITPFICYDLRFPEDFRTAILRGTTIFAVIANWPATRRDHWQTLLKARAIENQAFVVGVNRCGSDALHEYAGDTMIVDPQGNILAGPTAGECIIAAELNMDALTQWRRTFPVLGDMHSTPERTHHC